MSIDSLFVVYLLILSILPNRPQPLDQQLKNKSSIHPQKQSPI